MNLTKGYVFRWIQIFVTTPQTFQLLINLTQWWLSLAQLNPSLLINSRSFIQLEFEVSGVMAVFPVITISHPTFKLFWEEVVFEVEL